jgi:hypothetical protein
MGCVNHEFVYGTKFMHTIYLQRERVNEIVFSCFGIEVQLLKLTQVS